MIETGANILTPDKNGSSPFHGAIRLESSSLNLYLAHHALLYRKSVEMFKKLVLELKRTNVDKNALVMNGWSLLHKAIDFGLTCEAKLIIEARLENLIEWNLDGQSPLTAAIKKGNKGVVLCLIENGADLNCLDKRKFSPIHTAITSGQTEIANLLINFGAKLSDWDLYGKTPLTSAIEKGYFDIVMCLVENGADINKPDKSNILPIHQAIVNRKVKIAKYLFLTGDNLIQNDKKRKCSILTLSVKSKQVQLARFFIENGADINAKDGHGYTPLQHVIMSRNYILYSEMARLLLESGVDMAKNAINGWPPLTFAIWSVWKGYGHAEVVNLLIEFGADIDGTDRNGDTPIHSAITYNQLDTVKLLMFHGASFRCRNQDPNGNGIPKTPLEWTLHKAKRHPFKMIVHKNI